MTTNALAIRGEQDDWTEAQARALGFGPNVTRADAAIFLHVVKRTGLDPFARQIYMIERPSREGPKQTIQTGIDGYRVIARRAAGSKGYGYKPTEWCGPDGVWRDVWLSAEPPAAARVTVLFNGYEFSAVALWSEYAQTYGRGDQARLTPMWEKMKAGQLAKCAEALALRRAFPNDLSGLYTDDEMGQALPDPGPATTAASPRDRVMAALGDADAPLTGETIDPDQPPAPAPDGPPAGESADPPISDLTRRRLFALMKDAGVPDDAVSQRKAMGTILERTVKSRADLTEADGRKLIASLEQFIIDQSNDADGDE